MTLTASDEQTDHEIDIWPPDTAAPRWERFRSRFLGVESVVTLAVVAVCVLVVFKETQPTELFKNTTPAGGDLGAHVWLPDYVKRALLPHLRISGWTPDWYDGFPALTYYFPLPIISIALLSYVLPYNIAFKLIVVLGLLTLPVAAWAFGRLARMRFPGPACLAVATLPFLFGREFTIYGGNFASTMAGEFCFSISLSLAILFLGLVIRGLEDGKHRVSASIVLALCGLCHILPLFFALGGALILMAMTLVRTRDWRRLKWGIPVLLVGGALIAFWALPFELDLGYATNMGYEKITNYVPSLFPSGDDWLYAVAGLGAIASIFKRNMVGNFLTLAALGSAFVFRFAPAGRLWNARVLPFWFLCLYLLAGVAFMEFGLLIGELVRPGEDGRRSVTVSTAVVTLVAALLWVLFPLHWLPFGHTTASGKYTWLGVTTSDNSFVPDWVRWDFSGYQSPGKSREKEYFALVAEMQKLGQNPAYGCGRAMWEYEPELNDMGTPDALMLLPYWTDGCIGSQEGLYYESSGTTPYHFLNAAELSDQPANPVRNLDYPSAPNVAEGIEHLQMLGVKYFMAETPDIEAAADADSSLQLVGTVGPFPVTYTSSNNTSSSVKQQTWKIYEIDDSAEVSPLVNQPVVVKGASTHNWLKTSEAWYLNPTEWSVFEAASGPKNWARVTADQTSLPQTPLPPVQVSNIKEGTESISFDVDRTGVPVLVKTSYFPNWQAKGAKGVYRVTPNLMVVVPTAYHVTLDYGYTTVDWTGFILSLFGLMALVALWRLGPVAYAAPRARPRRSFRWGVRSDETDKVPGNMSTIDPEALGAVFKAYDIRGTVPDQINPDLARSVGAAFARFAESPRLLVARDMRPSGEELVAAFAEGATSVGADVINLGMCSTDELYFASGSLNAPGAIFTASHNPANYNGIKLCRAGARPVGADTGLREIKAMVLANGSMIPGLGEWPALGRVSRADVLGDYAAKVRSFVDLDALRPLKVVADTANGMGGLVVPAVFTGLPFHLDILYGELDGTFPNHPADPIQPENLLDLRRRILETGAHVGLAFDGDADRCFLVDDRGEPLSGSTTTALVAAAMLEKHPGATILHNLICSKAVPEIIRELGGVPVRTRVGHSYIKAVMADTDALFGGEHSGHYYFRDNYRADSGVIAALVVLEILCRDGQPLSEVRKSFERYADSGEINTEVSDPQAVIEAVARHFEGAKQDHLDGLTVDLGDWWFNLRPSNTEPLLRLNLEAADAASCQAHTAEVLSLISANSDLGQRG
jgi:phosphomannomutase